MWNVLELSRILNIVKFIFAAHVVIYLLETDVAYMAAHTYPQYKHLSLYTRNYCRKAELQIILSHFHRTAKYICKG